MKTFCAILLCTATLTGLAGEILFDRVPDNGIQPQVITDNSGAVHLLYYSGAAKGGDLYYVGPKDSGRRTEDGGHGPGKALRVNTVENSAIAAGTIRGGQIALGRNGRVHVAWNGARPQPDARHEGAPMYYARLNDAGTAFETQRDLIHTTGQLDGGGSVAADANRNVYVLWHGHRPGDPKGEIGRAVFLAISRDDGATFAPEIRANPEPTGACGCCGLDAQADRAGNLYVLYRTAETMVNRDAVLLMSGDKGQTFQKLLADPWNTGACPMSSAAFAPIASGVAIAWETKGQVRFTSVSSGAASEPIQPSGQGKRRHPAVAANKNGEILLVWAEGTGWERGGAVGWQLFDKNRKPAGEPGRRDGVPVWSFAAAYAKANGDFVILY
ncbi:MAG: BNR repeat-containing protein [Verrucomicrobia subdivision 3 bacterium]|nr:BNR repeat-containing protein [Limisphaerales bacterium]